MIKEIKYKSDNGYSGELYNWHYDTWTGEWNYSMRIWDKEGFEALHAYNATPKTAEELKAEVDNFPEETEMLKRALKMNGRWRK